MSSPPEVSALDQELDRARKVLDNWNIYGREIEQVRRLEMGTMMTPKHEQKQGYYRLPAVQGYEQIVNAYALVGNVTAEQRDKLTRVARTLEQLQTDQRDLGERPSPQVVQGFSALKMRELEQGGSIYLLSGHAKHFNITKISKMPNGGYSYTLYDAGHESQVIDWKGDRPVINAVEERMIKPGTDIRALIEADIAKRGAYAESPEYAAAKNFITASLLNPPLRIEQEYGQRKYNCTTRGQRILAADILQDPGLSEGLYDFASNVHGTSTDDIKQALQARVQHLESIKATGGENAWRGLDVGNFLKAASQDNYEQALLTLDSGEKLDAYRTKVGVFSEQELGTLQSTLERNGVKSMVRESVSQPGNFYLYVPMEQAAEVGNGLARDQSLAGDAYRKAGENAKVYLDVHSFVKMADPTQYESMTIPVAGGMRSVYRTKPGSFSKSELDTLQNTLARNGVAAEIQESSRSPGNFYLHVPQAAGPEVLKALGRDGSYAGVLFRQHGVNAPAHVEAVNAPQPAVKPLTPLDIMTDKNLWHRAHKDDNTPIIRCAVGDMSEGQVLALERELVKNGFRPVRHKSDTLGPTLRIEGGEANSLSNWQEKMAQWKQHQLKQAEPDAAPQAPEKKSGGFISNFIHKIIDIGGGGKQAPEQPKRTPTKPGGFGL